MELAETRTLRVLPALDVPSPSLLSQAARATVTRAAPRRDAVAREDFITAPLYSLAVRGAYSCAACAAVPWGRMAIDVRAWVADCSATYQRWQGVAIVCHFLPRCGLLIAMDSPSAPLPFPRGASRPVSGGTGRPVPGAVSGGTARPVPGGTA